MYFPIIDVLKENFIAKIPSIVTKWLDDNVVPVGSSVIVDESLSISGASADAKVTGNEINDLKSDIEPLEEENRKITRLLSYEHNTSVNKCNPNAITTGKYMALNGSLSNNSAYGYTDKIAVSEGDTVVCGYSMSGEIGSTSLYGNARFLTAFDASGNAVESKGATNTASYTVPAGITHIVCSLDTPTRNWFISTNGSHTYDTYYDVEAYYATPDFLKNVDSVLHCYLPRVIYVGVGRTVELYNNLVCLEADKYHIDWVCNVGVDYARKFSITGTSNNVGEYPLSFTVYDDNLTALKVLQSTVKIVNDSLTSTKYILPIGDSLTNQKPWLSEVQTLADNKIKFVGTRGTEQNNYKHEGRSGARAAWYNSDSSYTFDSNYVGNPSVTGTSNPFWNGTGFSLSHYLTNQGSYLDGTPDAVQLLLGTNGIELNPQTNANNIKTIVDSIKTEYPNMPIFVCNTIYRSNQNGYYSTGSDGYVSASDFQFDADMKIMNLQNALDEIFAEYTNVYIVPLSVCMDREYDFGNVPVAVNPRLSSITINIPAESVHPQNAGYMQIADVIYSAYCSEL